MLLISCQRFYSVTATKIDGEQVAIAEITCRMPAVANRDGYYVCDRHAPKEPDPEPVYEWNIDKGCTCILATDAEFVDDISEHCGCQNV